jgi:peptide/nickel transport system permease protein
MGSWIPEFAMARARWVQAVLPGLPHLLRGRWVEGGAALSLWLGLLALAVVRFDRILQAPGGRLDERVALLTLVLALGAVWGWSWRSGAGRGAASEEGEGNRGGILPGGWRAFRKNRMALLGLTMAVSFYLAMLLTPFLAPFDPLAMPAFDEAGHASLRLAPPSPSHIMGTDQYSRDIFSRILYGARISLTIGLLAVGISVTLGTFLGAVAGYLGGVVDSVLMRLLDMFMAFPGIVLLLAVVALFEPSVFLVAAALALTQWPFTTRMVRGEILALKEREFAEAARALGFSRVRVLVRHLLPNAMPSVVVVATLGIGNAIVLEAGLSFLGLGVPAATPSWGTMVDHGRAYLLDAWWVVTFPGLAIVLAVLAFNLLGDGLRDALDPRQGGTVER